ncbi:MAG: DnaJ domain-containing protein [Gammaproteobacteria bacterium]|nr:DnaJ domain-containing protein [Gammaproteobacteria bacterium]MDH5629068.1 DnaJ domain-containing protein [Gammaproteobacteria bacterium]
MNQRQREILEIIKQHGGFIAEYQLLQTLQAESPDFFEEVKKPVSLYRKHFFLFHQLYQMKDSLLDDGFQIEISPIQIQLVKIDQTGQEIGSTDPLAEFYLNEKNLYLSDEEIENMQKKFWQKYLALDKKAEAIKILKLESVEDLNLKIIKKQFNKLANIHHPDRGGNEKDFHLIKQAYEDLKCLF